MASGFRSQPVAALLEEVSASGLYGQSLAEVMLGYEDVYTLDERDDESHRFWISFLSEIATDTDAFPPQVRAIAMECLCNYTVYHEDDDVRSKITFSRSLYDVTTELAEHDDSEVSARAIRFMGHISRRLENVPRVEPSKSGQMRIDFDRANLEHVIRQYGPYRFAEVHPEDFERVVAELLRRGGFTVEVTVYIGDGADLVASKRNTRVAVQVKRYSSTTAVGVSDVNQVIGAMQYYNCDKGLVVTTSRFTQSAVIWLKKAAGGPVGLGSPRRPDP